MSRKETAILFFSLRPERESINKKLFPSGKKVNYRVHKLLSKKSWSVGTNSGLDFIPFDETKQRGNTFGERITNAFQETFELGYSNVICIGNDCPSLKTQHILEAQEQLSRGKTVLGPDKRGGLYLIGMCRESFDKNRFELLPWNTSRLFEGFLKSIAQKPALLESLNDLNKKSELNGYIRLSGGFLSSLLKRILFPETVKRVLYQNFTPSEYTASNFLLRGPPLC